MVTSLPNPIKNRRILQMQLDEQRHPNSEVLNDVLQQVLQCLIFKFNPSTKSRHYNILWADGNFRHCKPVIAALCADYPKYSDQHHLKWQVCFVYDCPQNIFGDDVPPDKQHPSQNHNLYRILSNANTKEADANLLSHNVHQGSNVFDIYHVS